MSAVSVPDLVEIAPRQGLHLTEMHCLSVQCPVLTFTGSMVLPLNSCPNCVRTGTLK